MGTLSAALESAKQASHSTKGSVPPACHNLLLVQAGVAMLSVGSESLRCSLMGAKAGDAQPNRIVMSNFEFYLPQRAGHVHLQKRATGQKVVLWHRVLCVGANPDV